MARPVPGLEPDEDLLATMTVTFRGSLAASWRGLGMASTRTRLKAFGAWSTAARQATFPVGKPEMIIGATGRRLLVWRPSFFAGRPRELVGSVPFERLAEVTVYRQGFAVSLTLLFTDGQIVEVEAMRKRRMRKIADIVRGGIGRGAP
ncbi:MAG: hypothetical protein JWL83_2564 [Actinomycetia bacterium]|nr:hypothetical protein [Actinomycetes bacterium]